MRDLIQTEKEISKEISRPSQEEAGFKALADAGTPTCASCRWFKSAEGEDQFGYCHLIQNTPLDVSEKSTCERHEMGQESGQEIGQEIAEAKQDETPPSEFSEGGVFVSEDNPLPALLDDALKEIELPQATKDSIRDRVWNRIAERLGFNRKEVPLSTGLKVAGNHWFISWSNNFADLEGEIFTQKAMDDYVRRVDMGVISPPELWVWHAGKDARIGKADWVARHGHFLVAAGEFDTTEKAVKARDYYRRNAHKTAVSHGYTYPSSKFDGKHYHSFNTFEISLLPRGKEANPHTSLERIKQMTVNGSISDEKRAYMRDVFKEDADALLAPLEELGKSLETMGMEFKDFTAVPEANSLETTPAVTEQVEADVKALVGDLVKDTAQIAEWTIAVGKALKGQQTVLDQHLGSYASMIQHLQAEIDGLKEMLDGRPKSASTAEETTLEGIEKARLEAISKQADKQMEVTHPFWGTRTTVTP